MTTGLSWFRFDAADYAVHWKRRVVREDSEVQLEMTLERGGTVVGTVVGPNGIPVASARIWSTTHDGVHEISTTSSPSGEFRLKGIPAGPRFLFARGGKDRGFGARTRVLVESGGEVSWYPELIPLPSIKLRLVNQDDVPLANTDVHMRVKSGSRMTPFDEKTDDDGALVVHEQSNKVDRIDFYLTTRYGSVFNFPDAHLDEIQLGDTLHTVVVDEAILNKGRIEFELTSAKGEAFEEVAILARRKRDAVTRRIFVAHGDTSIRAPHVVPDELQLIASCTGLGNLELGTVSLNPGETLQMPAVRAPELGTVHIDWRYPEGGGEEIGIVQHLREVKMKAIGLRLNRTEALTPLESYQLLPGDYSLHVSRNRGLVQVVRFTITSGFETSIEVHPEGESGE